MLGVPSTPTATRGRGPSAADAFPREVIVAFQQTAQARSFARMAGVPSICSPFARDDVRLQPVRVAFARHATRLVREVCAATIGPVQQSRRAGLIPAVRRNRKCTNA